MIGTVVLERRASSAVEANLVDHFALFGSAPGSESHVSREAAWVATEVVHPVPNGVFRFNLPPARADQPIDQILSMFRRRCVPFRWVVGPSARPNDLGARLEARGLTHTRDWVGMAANLGPQRTFRQASGATIVEVGSHAAFEDALTVLGEGFGFPAELTVLFEATFGRRRLGPAEPIRHFIARIDGRAAATSSLHLTSGVAGLYWVATAPWARGRGIGTDLVQAALRAATDAGAVLAVLQSTAMGLGPYRRAGFHDVSRLAIYEQDE